MDISGIANLATQMTQQRTSDQAQLLVLKKAMEMQQATAATLLSSLAPAANLPAHLGQNVNVVA